MNQKETVEALMDCLQKGDFKRAGSLLAYDFQFSGAVPVPIHKEAWLEMSARLKAACPDLNYHFEIDSAEGDVVRIASKLSGTHSGTLDLTVMNMGVIAATGKTLSVKLEKARVTVRENRVTSWVVEPTYGGGVTAILSQIGFAPASM